MTRLRELTLDEMLADPIVHLVMRRDGVEETYIRSLMARLRAHRATRPPALEPECCAAA